MPDEIDNRLVLEQKIVIERLSSSYKNGRIGHAYIFDGERGTGKEAVALFFAKLLLCVNPENAVPCETCNSCRRVASSNHPNVTIIRPDGQGIKKEQMSDLVYSMTKKDMRQTGRYILFPEQTV